MQPLYQRGIADQDRAHALGAKVLAALTKAQALLVGCEARLISTAAGKFIGRTGAITSVAPSSKGGIAALVMVHRIHPTPADGPYLNSEPATRSYWPLHDILLTGRRIFMPTTTTDSPT